MKSYLCIINVLAGIIMVVEKNYEWSTLLMVSAFASFILQNKSSWSEMTYYGIANLITTVRFLLILVFIFFSTRLPFNDYKICLLILTIPLLDILDGLVARQRKEESRFGMYYDLEVDALYVLVTSIIIFNNHPSMWVVLIPAFLRYLYKFSLDMLDRKQKFVESKQKYASVIAGNYFVAIIIFNIFDHEFSRWYLSISSILIIISFLKSAFEFARWKQSYDLSY